MIYGKPPKFIRTIHAKPSEYCFSLYLPIFMANDHLSGIKVPENLSWTREIINSALSNESINHNGFNDKYVYLTVKYMFVSGYSANRPGWHSDGFMSDDVNYVWCDSSPTQYCVQSFDLTQCHNKSMIEMEEQAQEKNIVAPKPNQLMRIDQSVIHRVPFCADGFRAFVKISISENIYNLAGNAHNNDFNYDWVLSDREAIRNHPTADVNEEI